MSAGRPPSPQADFKARVSRYARLRAAQRALAAAAPLPTRFEAGSAARARLRELESSPHVQLGDQAPAPDAAWAEALAEADGLLTRYAGELRVATSEVPGAQFRATLPPLLGEDRAAVVGLLDLCVADKSDERRSWLKLIDYLVTLLAAEDAPDGSRRVAHDPAQVSPRLRRLCAAKAKRQDDRALGLAEEVRLATDALAGNDDASELIERVKAVKADMGDGYFHPTLLRAVTSYNVAAANRLRARADQERAQDQTFYGRLGLDEEQELAAETPLPPGIFPDAGPPPGIHPDADDEAPTATPGGIHPDPAPPAGIHADPEPAVGIHPDPAPPLEAVQAPEPLAEDAPIPEAVAPEPEPEEPVVSVFESPGLGAVEVALDALLTRKSRHEGPAGALAAALDASALRPWERTAFVEHEQPGAGVVRTCVTLGLLLRLDDAAREPLAALDVELDAVVDAWSGELHAALQKATKSCLSGGDYERARDLGNTRGEWLPRARAAAPAAAPPPPSEPEAEPAAEERPSARFDPMYEAPSGDPASRREERKKGKKKAKKARGPRRRRSLPPTLRRVATMLLVGGLLGGAMHLLTGDPKPVDPGRAYLGATDLARLSPDLTDAFTVERSGRTVFVATVLPSWHDLEAEERKAEARSLNKELVDSGVSEVILVDADRRVQLHLVDNRFRTFRD